MIFLIGIMLHIKVLDKRHVGLVSTNMEKEAVPRSLDLLTKEVKVVELMPPHL